MRVVSSVHFFTPAEVHQLSLATGVAQSSTSVKRQSQVLGFLQALSSRIGFPQRTVATAQLLYMRFHLFYTPSDFVPHEVGIACLVVAAKMNDTPKKSREVILSSWALRYPELVRSVPLGKAAANQGSRGVANSLSAPPAVPAAMSGLGIVSESDVDPNVLETERKRILALESLVLQTIAFDFNVQTTDNLLLTVKLAKKYGADKSLARLAWQVAADSHRTSAPLSYPPSTIAAASLYAASMLSLRCNTPSPAAADVIKRFDQTSTVGGDMRQEWEQMLCCTIDHVEEVVHSLLDLYGMAVAALPTSSSSSTGITPISPATPASPSEAATTESMLLDARNSSTSKKLPPHVYSPPPFGLLHWCNHGTPGTTVDMLNELTQMKIGLRHNEEQRGPGRGQAATPALPRRFDKGGVRGDVRRQSDGDEDDVNESWEKRAKDRQFSALQRFLF